MDPQQHFIKGARISRTAIARYLDLDLGEVDDLADDLELPRRLTLEQFEELIEAFDDEGDNEEEDEDDNGDNENAGKEEGDDNGDNEDEDNGDNGDNEDEGEDDDS